ncbi:MAG: DoxX family protein [Bacteroidota bacterium]|nr:DoxX family protein [Bacteroidota bacterium]
MKIKEWLYPNTYGLRIDFSLLVLRLVFGGLMLSHGIPKLSNVLEGNLEFGNPIGIGTELTLFSAVFAEFLCSILIILGLLTRFAAIPLILTMAVAAFIVLADDPLKVKEVALLYLTGFYILYLTGPGNYSLDAKIFKP